MYSPSLRAMTTHQDKQTISFNWFSLLKDRFEMRGYRRDIVSIKHGGIQSETGDGIKAKIQLGMTELRRGDKFRKKLILNTSSDARKD